MEIIREQDIQKKLYTFRDHLNKVKDFLDKFWGLAETMYQKPSWNLFEPLDTSSMKFIIFKLFPSKQKGQLMHRVRDSCPSFLNRSHLWQKIVCPNQSSSDIKDILMPY